MTNLENKIKSELEKRFRDAGTDRITITMKHDGNELTLTLCTECPESISLANPGTTLDSFDWILVGGNGAAVQMGGRPDDVVKQLAGYEKLAGEYQDERKRLYDYFLAHKDEAVPCCESDAFGWYSDWHKDVFGYRPRGWEYNRMGA